MIEVMEKSLWNKKEYLELLEFIEAAAIAKMLSGHDVKCQIRANKFIYRVDNTGVGFIIELHNWGNPQIEFTFKDKKFKSSGYKGNLKNEGFNYDAKIDRNLGWVNYKFTLDNELEKQVKQILRLFKLFKKYI